MHICPKCRRTIPDARFCPYCAAEQAPPQNQQMPQNYSQYQNRQVQQNQIPYQNPNPYNYPQHPHPAAPPMQHNNGIGQTPPKQNQWQQSPQHVQQKKNAVIVDEKDFVIYDVPPKDSTPSDKLVPPKAPEKNHVDILRSEKHEDRAPITDKDVIHGYGMSIDEDPDKTRIFIRPPKKKTSDITEPDSYRRPEKDFRFSKNEQQKKETPKLHIYNTQPSIPISTKLLDLLQPPRLTLCVNSQAAVPIPAVMLRMLNSSEDESREPNVKAAKDEINTNTHLPLFLVTQSAVVVSDALRFS